MARRRSRKQSQQTDVAPTEQEQAFKLGAAAFGRPRPTNPFKSSVLRDAWNEGFADARLGGELGRQIIERLKERGTVALITLADSFRPVAYSDVSEAVRRLAAAGAVDVERHADSRLEDLITIARGIDN